MLNKIDVIFNNLILKLRNFLLNYNNLEINSKLLIDSIKKNLLKRNLPSYILDGYRVYSQNDEDGIINSIFNDIGFDKKIFVEIGVGNGVENNTHNLILQDWTGVWIDSNTSSLKKIENKLNNNKLILENKKITPDNINETISYTLKNLFNDTSFNVDFLSIDIDSFDIFCIEKLNIINPRLICIEYNSKFPPPINISINPNKNFEWNHDDYNGASLFFINNKLNQKGYKLVSTNITGVNAFFVADKYYNKCKTKNQNLEQLYMPSNYNLFNYYQSHRPSLKYLFDKLDTEN
ncbi:MAG: hypothetical protein CFH16_00528 [Alphaproteobacteria bacterium MarineAlpha5_Bin6]|mgnify:CR=1 FL=1|nr:MAG: hypothetical protein CFH17_01062 [Alphaproteobacteria bacterium MarineAlpha5_Bin7]PPR54274.1 MAG: hypothetical protein CFH16_00528 [Alphaproteobacteria bacterium MarineAlpha5_Bin6]|tara:strand:+ start:5048 stop:5923 length:876 start_codon:yes stop_codon:yes gene_type:complete